ncbi:MAG: GNAT family N-acetyltransferase [Dehalococcoidia bacterium]
MSDLSIRPYEPRDLEACRGLWRELTQRHRDIYEDQTIGGDDPGPYFDTYIERSDLAGAWVVEVEGAVAGLTGLLVNDDEAEVEPVVVTAALRSRGIGRRLLERMIEEARSRSIRFLSIRPVARNVEAIALFHEAGFRTLGHLDMFMHLGNDEREFKQGVTVHGRDFSY